MVKFSKPACSTLPLRRCARLVAGLTAGLALAACGGSSATTAGAGPAATSPVANASAHTAANTIAIHMFAFHPSSLTVAPGATVTVHNADSTTHTLTDKANPKLFTTGDISPGGTKTFKAPSKAGSYPYICLIHQYMAGTLVVR
jgi:plastocyanin